MKLSVIMSVYNGERYLKEAIESILNQTFKNFEFIIIDDGSTDKSPQILDKYAKKDKRIKLIHQKNIGLTKSLNKALKLAQGKYIARIDADDIAYKSRFKKQIRFLEKHPKIGLVGNYVDVIDEKGKNIGRLIYPTNDKDIRKVLIKKNPFCHSTIMFRKEVAEKVGGYNKDFSAAQDYDFWMRISKHYQIANLSEVLGAWRLRKKAITFQKNISQIKANLRIQIKAIKDGLYPWYYLIFLLRTIFLFVFPIRFRSFIKKRFLWKKRTHHQDTK